MPEQRPQSTGPPTPVRRWKRTIGGAAAALLLLVGGAIVNVAVAWGLVLPNAKPGVPVFEELDEAATSRYWDELALTTWGAPRSLSGIRTVDRLGTSGGVVHELALSDMKAVVWQDYGLPVGTMRAVGLMEGGLVVLERRIVFAGKSLPTQPVMPGFIINTLFYALLLWLLIFAPFAARRILRRRRGQCETCAYPIGVSSACTECGAAVRPRSMVPLR